MDLLEGSWFLTSFLIIAIVLLVDPKSSLTSASSVSGLFSSPSSGQQFIYKFSAILIVVFFILTLIISLGS
jgi:protein translocase SecG subunit